MKAVTNLIPLLLCSLVYGGDKSSIDTVVDNILKPRHIEMNGVKKSPFVGETSPRSNPPSPSKKSTAPKLEIQGIINKKALINGTLYGVGERIEGYLLQSITENGVTFLKQGTLYTAKLFGRSKIQIKRDR